MSTKGGRRKAEGEKIWRFGDLEICCFLATGHWPLATVFSALRLPPSALILIFFLATPAFAVEHIKARRDGKTAEATGRVLVEAQDGGIVLLARDGVLWPVPSEQLLHRSSDKMPFKPATRDEITQGLLAELPPGFRAHNTNHYLILHDTSPAYAQWCGSLFERLYMAFNNYWRRKGFKIAEPEFPLVAIVFADRAAYRKFSRAELGNISDSITGYFGLLTNRMTMCDLTGLEAQGLGARRTQTTSQINHILSQPGALQTVATIVHEATHQIAYNCGLHQRLSDCPLWLVEGIAVYFETPDLRSARGWSGIGGINQTRFARFKRYCPMRPANSLQTLIRDDTRFRDPKQALDAYAEAWALTYFLVRKHPKEFVDYLAMLSKKKPLEEDSPRERLDQFRRFFGDFRQLDTEFLRYMAKIQ